MMNHRFSLGARMLVVAFMASVGLAARQTHAAGWTLATSPTSSDIFGIDCGSTDVCVAVGADGMIMRTADHKTWSTVSSGVTYDLYAVDMSSATMGIAVGEESTILTTADGGSTWTRITGVGEGDFWSVSSASTTVAYAVGQSGIYRTNNAGATWSDVWSGSTVLSFYAVDAVTPTTAFAAGDDGMLYRTTTSGTLWTAIDAGISADILALEAPTTAVLYVGAKNGILRKSINVNATTPTFTTLATSPAEVIGGEFYVNDVACTSSTVCLFASGTGTGGGLASTTDGSTLTTDDDDYAWNAITNYSTSRQFAAGNGGVLVTYDATAPEAPTDLSLSTLSSSTTSTTPTIIWTKSVDGESSVSGYTVEIDSSGTWQEAGDVTEYVLSTPLSAGEHTVNVRAIDAGGNTSSSASLSFTVSLSSDTTAPTVGTISPSSTTASSSVTVSASYSDAVGVTSCTVHVNDVAAGSMSMTSGTSGTASASVNLSTAGTYEILVTCRDAAGNAGTATGDIVVAAAADTTAPTVGAIGITAIVQNTATTFSVTAADAVGISSCSLFVNGVNQGSMAAGSSNMYGRSYTAATSGTVTAYATCIDAAGNTGTGSSATITVIAVEEGETDTTAPTVGVITPSAVTVDTATTLSASVADGGGMGSCVIYINSVNYGAMTLNQSTALATYVYTFTAAGTAVANAYCVDAAGNATRGGSTTITITDSDETTEEEDDAVSEADTGELLKLACGANADVEDPCHAIYYYGEDGKRHAFPNEKVFFTWYDGFEDVIIVTDDFLASITLGKNVTYHPGTRLVKFVTVNTVYAVGEEGELRGISSEEVAASIFGSTWNKQIDDISDAFFSNYTFGEEINSTSDYDPDDAEDAVDTIDEILP
jgi:photosystem II stability/assembly factor-like uncharacterized protein